MIAQIISMGHIPVKRNANVINTKSKTKISRLSAPYFERNTFLKEETSTQELMSMHDIGFVKMTKDDLIESKAALNVIGYDPSIKLVNLLIENDVLGLSRPGVDNHPQLNFFTTLLPRLKKEAGATHLALSLPTSLQKLLDVFIVTGEILPTLSSVNLADYGLKGNSDYVSLLKAARLAGYILTAIEPDLPLKAFDPQNERTMAANIQAILKSEERAKVIFLAPDRHLAYTNIGDWIPAAAILKDAGVNISTVNQYWQNDFMPQVFACLLRGLNRPVAIASKDVKMFAALQSKSLKLENILPNNWDISIFYPKAISGKSKLIKQSIYQMTAVISRTFSFIRQK